MIAKNPYDKTKYRYPVFYYNQARSALKNVLQALLNVGRYTLLLPSYIGISPKEGSGIFDPICELGIDYQFYQMDEKICIDFNHYETLLKGISGRKVVLLVDFFGYVDKAYEQVISMAHENGAVVIEDAAHALFTDYVDAKCGRRSDCVIYSLHKMFALDMGGMLRLCSDVWDINDFRDEGNIRFDLANYDLSAIAARRKDNARYWKELLKNCSKVKLLREDIIFADQTPQSFPILLYDYDRYQLYLELNQRGFGIISLYHTLIEPLQQPEYRRSNYVSERILNLPVHQDIGREEIDKMYKELIYLIK